MYDKMRAHIFFVPPDRDGKKYHGWRVVLTEGQLREHINGMPEHRAVNCILVESGVAPIGINEPDGRFMRMAEGKCQK